MCDLTSGVFEHVEITSPIDVGKIVNYTQRLLRILAHIKYKKNPGGVQGVGEGYFWGSVDAWRNKRCKYVEILNLGKARCNQCVRGGVLWYKQVP